MVVISKSNFIAKFKFHWSGFNTHKSFLRQTVDNANEQLQSHEIDSIKISLVNMKEQLDAVEKFLSENSNI